MEKIDILLILLSLSCVLLIALLAFAFRQTMTMKRDLESVGRISVAYFTDVVYAERFFRKKANVTLKAHLLLNGVPVGTPILLREISEEIFNSDRYNEIKDEFLKPLVNTGISVLERQSGVEGFHQAVKQTIA